MGRKGELQAPEIILVQRSRFPLHFCPIGSSRPPEILLEPQFPLCSYPDSLHKPFLFMPSCLTNGTILDGKYTSIARDSAKSWGAYIMPTSLAVQARL